MAMTSAYARQLLTTSTETAVFTAGSGGAVVTNIVLCNVTASPALITVTLNDAATGKIALISGASVAANSTVTFDIKQPLGASKVLYATAGTANAIAIHVGGVNL